MWSHLFGGAVAGAAGTTALNAATYVDMTIRGRPASSIPECSVEAITSRIGLRVPGEAEIRDNRLTGLGALSGIATGVVVGALFGALRASGFRPRRSAGAVLVGLTAMAATDASMVRLGVSDPRTWSVGDWLADLVPHLAYGAVVTVGLDYLDRGVR
jgi:hypothetical protein